MEQINSIAKILLENIGAANFLALHYNFHKTYETTLAYQLFIADNMEQGDRSHSKFKNGWASKQDKHRARELDTIWTIERGYVKGERIETVSNCLSLLQALNVEEKTPLLINFSQELEKQLRALVDNTGSSFSLSVIDNDTSPDEKPWEEIDRRFTNWVGTRDRAEVAKDAQLWQITIRNAKNKSYKFLIGDSFLALLNYLQITPKLEKYWLDEGVSTGINIDKESTLKI